MNSTGVHLYVESKDLAAIFFIISPLFRLASSMGKSISMFCLLNDDVPFIYARYKSALCLDRGGRRSTWDERARLAKIQLLASSR